MATKKTKPCKSVTYRVFCGERGIRTPGPVTVNGFQDRRNRPLCHLSIFLRTSGFVTVNLVIRDETETTTLPSLP